MPAVQQLWQLGLDALSCCLLGLPLGAARALLPGRGRAAFLPDMLLIGAMLLLLQSYAAGASCAGTLRWYMALACAAGVFAAHCALALPVRLLRRAMAAPAAAARRFLLRRAVLPALSAAEARRERQSPAKLRRSEKTAAKKPEKGLQKHRHLLYNSNV